MPTLREALQEFDQQLTIVRPVAPMRVAAERDELERKLGDVAVRLPDANLLAATYKELRSLAASGKALDKLPTAHLKRAPWVIFEARDPETNALAENVDFIKAYLRELIRRASASAISTLIYCFLLFYPRHLPVFHPLQRLLASHVLPTGRGSRIDKWRNCISQCGLLEEDTPLRLGKHLAESEVTPDALLENCCLRGMLATGGLVEQGFLAWIQNVHRQLASGRCSASQVERILEYATDPEGGSGLRYEKSRVALADGLLLPFADGNPGPKPAELIKNFLLKTLGDPRLVGAKRWNGVDRRARQVMYGWLVSITLEDFFRLLEYAAQSDATARRHWRARKAFWSRYLNSGLIRDAWVALGPRTQVEAHSFLSSESRAYAKLKRGYSVLPNHSAIIMRIGDLTITEWSHSGKFRVWFVGNAKHPPLYRDSYTRDVLIRNANDEVVHHSSWQRKVSDLIYDQTGLSA